MSVRSSLLRPLALFNQLLALKGADLFVPLGQVRGATGLVTTATLASGVWAQVFASHAHYLGGELADGNTKTSTGTFEFRLPDHYRQGQSVTVKFGTRLKKVAGTGAADNGSDIDCLAYETASGITVGSDLCLTSAQVYAAVDTDYVKEFVIDPAGLVAGDNVKVEVVGRAIENDAGNGSLQSVLYSIVVALGAVTE